MADITSEKMTVEQKFAKAMLHLRILRPFYSAVYEVLDKREVAGLGSMGVGTNNMVYDKEFVDGLPFEEFLFVLLHEISHIALQHVARRENRDPQLWNSAADLYSNKVLADEFGVKPGTSNTINGITITMPLGAYYCGSVDTDVDYTELIYEDLEKQAKSNQYMKDSMSKTSDQEDENGEGKGNNGDSNSQYGKQYTFSYTGSSPSNSYNGGNQSRNTFTFSIKHGDKLDLIDAGEDQSIKEQKSEKVVSDAMVRIEMSSQSCGDESAGLMGYVKKMMKSELDWKKLLRKYLITATTTDSSFSRPDKRMYYQNSIYPGQVSDESSVIKGVKVCIDTSGSISDDDIAYFCGQVYNLTKQFKIEAELIYWDTCVQSTGTFDGYKEFERVALIGRGGTDPSVIFNYFDTKKCKVKPIVTLVFTDAYFSTDKITAKQRKKYKDTIWIMTRHHDTGFEAPFGKKAIAKFS